MLLSDWPCFYFKIINLTIHLVIGLIIGLAINDRVLIALKIIIGLSK